jgi:hypothetical protein
MASRDPHNPALILAHSLPIATPPMVVEPSPNAAVAQMDKEKADQEDATMTATCVWMLTPKLVSV